MISGPSVSARLRADPEMFARCLDCIPFGFQHALSTLEHFSDASLLSLAEKYDGGDYFVAAGAPSPDTGFYAVPHGTQTPREALQNLESGNYRVLMKRPERHDRRFRDLLDALFGDVLAMRRELESERIVRLDSSILVSASAAITPFHFDPEISFFFQIEGEKTYHLYEPGVMSEAELERFYVKGIVNIGEAALADRPRAAEHIFALGPGKGLHQPKNAPHWVETHASRSVSYAFSFETERTRALGRTRSFNRYLRAMGASPALPGTHPTRDALKATAMQLVTPLRKGLAAQMRRTRVSS